MIVVLSNLHSNLPAFSSILSEVERRKENGADIGGIYIISAFGLMPYQREIYKMLSEKPEEVKVVAGKYDRLLAKWGEIDERKKEEYGVMAEVLDFYWEMLGHEGRKWIKSMEANTITEKFGWNRFYFAYGTPANPNEMPDESATSPYYEARFGDLKGYEAIVVAGSRPYSLQTNAGRIICPGTAGLGKKSSFAIIDTRNLSVSFEEVHYSISEVESRIEELDVSQKAKDFLKEALFRKKIV